jgi:hypothetical protein
LVYPNPASDFLVVNHDNYFKSPVFVEIFSVTGQKFLSKVMSFVSGELKINISDLPDNLYLLHITEQAKGKIISSKFIKQVGNYRIIMK